MELEGGYDMAERNTVRLDNLGKAGSPINMSEFAEYVEKQARTMELSGWKDVQGLRKWVFELRRKSNESKAFAE